ncbi:ABC transporter substrate-binding protein [Streptomyces yerevanensis]|uniref:ABC transporter substrate-binding protein n=1 Tax=Streptomyces yerevanensis TaxID=66378 RepID=UPI000526DFD6|nr:ABC transporter substrate-binding protein [Streptomyces yerevanensis]
MIRTTRLTTGVTVASLVAFALSGCAESAAADPKKLTVSTFGFGADRFEEAVVKPFEKKTGIDVTVETGANADRLTKLRVNKTDPTVDVVMISDLFAAMGQKQGLFDKVDPAKVPNMAKTYDFARSEDGYGPAYTYQLLGMLYRTDRFEQPPTLQDLWDAKHKGKVAVPDMSTSAGAPFLQAASATYGSGPKDTDTGFKKLSDLKPNVLKFFSRSTELVSLLDRGEVEMAPGLDLFAVDPAKAGKPIGWAPFDKGRYVAANTAQIVKGGKNKTGAEKFIDYLLSADVQEQAAASFNDKPVNQDAEVPATISEVAGKAASDPAAAGFASPDLAYSVEHNDEWVDRFQREVSG